jgi:hypothetical protein
LQYRKEGNSNNTSALDNTVKSIDMLTMIQSEFRCTNFNSVDEAYKLLISRLEEAGCYVATSKQDINEYTFADEENPAVEGETFKVQCDIQEGSEVFVYEFRIREYYTDPGSSDYAYVIDVYRDRHFVFSSLKK